jgi:hypothetical protein
MSGNRSGHSVSRAEHSESWGGSSHAVSEYSTTRALTAMVSPTCFGSRYELDAPRGERAFPMRLSQRSGFSKGGARPV